MQTYRLKFEDDGIGVDKIVEFDSPNQGEALLVMQNHARGRWAELWHEGRLLCGVCRERDGLFLVVPRSRQVLSCEVPVTRAACFD